LAGAGEAGDLDRLVRRVDPDRWLASRFIGDVAARADVIALYAFDYELERARKAASNALVAEMRLAWWSEVLDEIFDGRPVRKHPTAQALALARNRHSLPRSDLEAMIDGRAEVLDEATLAAPAAIRWADLTAGSAARLCAIILDANAPPEAAAPAGRALGLAFLGRDGRAGLDVVGAALREALAQARRSARLLSVEAFPAALAARLARFDLKGAAPPLWRKQLSLLAASVSGQL